MNNQDEGFALIAVLGLMLMLSVIALGILQFAQIGARAASGERESVKHKYLVTAALAQFEHEVISDAQKRKNLGGEHTLNVFGNNVVFTVSSENERLNINRASEDEIAKYLKSKAIAIKDAKRLAARIIDWRDRDNLKRPGGGEAIDYIEPGIRPRNSAFESVSELRYIFETENIAFNADNYTIYSNSSGGEKVTGNDIIGRSVGVAMIEVNIGAQNTKLIARIIPSAGKSMRKLH